MNVVATIELSWREIEVARLASRGYTIKEVAGELYLSPRAIEGRRDRLLEKLGAKNMTHAVSILFRKGILQ